MIAKGVTPILNVSDLAESFAWFEKLGWKKGWDWGTPPTFGGVSSGACEIFLCQGAQGGRGKGGVEATFGPDGDSSADKGVWMSIWVDDVDASHRHCLEQGLEVAWPPTDMPWGVREMHVRHPDGHVFRISGPIAGADESRESGATDEAAADLEAALSELEGMPDFLAARFGSLPSEQAALAGPGGSFSPVEHCWHLADLEREGYGVRIARLLHENEPFLPDFDGARIAEERQYRGKALGEGLRAFREARRTTVAALRGLRPAQWSRRGSQEGKGAVVLSDVPRLMAEHDKMHKAEIEAWALEHGRAERCEAGVPRKVNLSEKLALFRELWTPKAVGAVNDFQVKLVKLKGEFVWHSHEIEDELFLVLRGRLRLQFRDGEVVVEPGELVIVPHGTEHRPVADDEVHVLLLEPASTVNTGTAGGERTREVDWI